MSTTIEDSSKSRSGRIGLITLFVAAFMTITTETLPMGLLPQIGGSLDVSESRVGLLVAVYAFLIMFVTLPITAWTARWPRRRLFVVIMGAFAVSNLLVAVAPSYPVAVTGRLIAALVHGVLWSMMASYATKLVPADRAGRAVAVVFAGNSAALTLGVPLGTAVGNTLGWRTAFVVLAVIAALLIVVAPLLLPQVPGSTAAGSGVGKAFRIPGVLAIAGTTTLVMLGHFTLYTYISPYLQHVGVSETAVSPVLFAFGLAGIAGVWAAGLLVDRKPRGAALSFVGLVVLALAALAAVGEATVVVIALVVVWGLFYAGLPTLLQSAVLKAAPQAQTAASALFIIGFNLGTGGGSVVGGQVLDHIGVAALPLVAAVLAAVGWLIVAGGRKAAFPRHSPEAVVPPELDGDTELARDLALHH